MRVRVLTWNIHKGIGGVDRRYRLDRVIDAMKEIAPDVALLQEVADDLPRSQFHDQAEMLGEALGLSHIAFGPEHRFAMGGYGNAILSRFPLFDVTREDLTIGTRKRRGVLQAHARIRMEETSRTVVFHNMHLGLAGSERALQLEKFLSSGPFRGIHEHTPVVVGGDLNDVWGTLGPRFLIPSGFRRVGPLANTFPAAFPVRPLDALFVRGDLHTVEPARPRKSALTRVASDHLPLVADLSLRGRHG
ncbi:MAG TPA: endonuclease/exonuclease/phosphatase family protein [Polyangiaceae bacterium]|nr:endonuclease/exonuclease/phosphatase family protein [Polyangiaceae bacterium]